MKKQTQYPNLFFIKCNKNCTLTLPFSSSKPTHMRLTLPPHKKSWLDNSRPITEVLNSPINYKDYHISKKPIQAQNLQPKSRSNKQSKFMDKLQN